MAHRHRGLAALIAVTLAGCTAVSTGNVSSTATAPTSVAPSRSPSQSTADATPSPAVSAVIPLVADFYSVAAGAEGIWLLSPTGKVIRIDPVTNKVAATVEVPKSEFGNIAVGAGSVWVTDFDHDALVRIDPTTKAVVASVKVGPNPEGLLVTPKTVWVSNHRGGSVSKVDVASNRVRGTYKFAHEGTSGPKDLVLVDDDLWTTAPNSLGLFRIDQDTGDLVRKVSILAEDIAGPITDGRSIYVRTGGDTMVRVDPATNEIDPAFAPAQVPDAFGLASFWTFSGQDLIRLDAGTLTPTGRWSVLPKGIGPTNVAFDQDSLWVATDGRMLIHVEPGD